MNAHPRRILINLDGAMLEYKDPTRLGDPAPGVHDALREIGKLADGATPPIEVWAMTTRPEEQRPLIEAHLAKHNLHVDGIAFRQPIAHAIVDCRAVPFGGQWEGIVESVAGLLGLGYRAGSGLAQNEAWSSEESASALLT